MFVRPAVYDGGMQRVARNGDAIASRKLSVITTDAAQTLAFADMAGGLVSFSSFTAGRVVTTDTAVNILAANPWMDIGDQFELLVSCNAAFAATWAAGAGVTLAGRATTPASSSTVIVVTKTSATTVTWTVL